MKIKTHEKILRFILGIPDLRVPLETVDQYDYDNLPEGWGGCYDHSKLTIYIREGSLDPFVLAHEFYHAKQWKQIYKRKYHKAFTNFKEMPEDIYNDFWGFRRYKYQLVEKEANRFALRYCLLTFEWKTYRYYLKYEIRDFFLYRLGFKLIIDGYRSIRSFFQEIFNQ